MIKGIKQLLDQEKLKRLGLLSLEGRTIEDVCVCMIGCYKITTVVEKVNASSNLTTFELGTFNETSRRSTVNKWKKVIPKTVSGELLNLLSQSCGGRQHHQIHEGYTQIHG